MASAAEVLAVFIYWQDRMVKPRARLDAKREKNIRERLNDGYTVRDLMDAVDGCRQSAWHQGRNPGNKIYNDIELICRDAKHVDDFIEECLKWRKLEEARKLEKARREAEELQLAEERAKRVAPEKRIPPWRKQEQ